ncbi:hypothetical protein MKEN_01292300 [Mycena kentingensis (nom. inval.)]|nr:hypothetical protein MKEN_01292300 [Mycena kentingensis (nom. inval.)]
MSSDCDDEHANADVDARSTSESCPPSPSNSQYGLWLLKQLPSQYEESQDLEYGEAEAAHYAKKQRRHSTATTSSVSTPDPCAMPSPPLQQRPPSHNVGKLFDPAYVSSFEGSTPASPTRPDDPSTYEIDSLNETIRRLTAQVNSGHRRSAERFQELKKEREENRKLRERVHELEEKLRDAEDQVQEWFDAARMARPLARLLRPTRRVPRNLDDVEEKSEWFPWPDKETCVLDILRHVPRCAFSKKQNTAIHWAMQVLGVPNLPSDRVMDEIDKKLQPICGVQSIRYEGKLGHTYYVNDFAAIIAQELANPTIRKQLRFLPEDAGKSLSEAWQADRWLNEMDPDLATPMIRMGNEDFFVHEPAITTTGVYMPTRWYTKVDRTYARAWRMVPAAHNTGWYVDVRRTWDIPAENFTVSFKAFTSCYGERGYPDPRIIHGKLIPGPDSTYQTAEWTLTDPLKPNRWRVHAKGHRVVAFPVWLYCDDTSGNVSKKWNKHNSFLFTAAGLPRSCVHQESNIHFLSTSNIAPPLEMLDGIVEQLEQAQAGGIWAWDCEYQELVLVILSVFAMLGDNPMQSEFACHIGFRGKFFCRVCNVKGDPEGVQEDDAEMSGASDSEHAPRRPPTPTQTKKAKPKKDQTLDETIQRIKQFMAVCSPTIRSRRILLSDLQIGRPRTREETTSQLRSQFQAACVVGGKAEYQRQKTSTGTKDTYMEAFLEKIFDISTRRGSTQQQKQTQIAALQASLPSELTSPVWRIKDLDPHCDTPVEILHVILLGFVKYFWRDAVARIKNKDKPTLIARLDSFDVSGLGFSPLRGHTLVTYSGSLTGRDFRAIIQAAPFVLQGLLTKERLETWNALNAVATLVWQPRIDDITTYIPTLESAIHHFLDCVCRLDSTWFNKPKFHVLLHLPAHIRRFGPAMLFATEGFESFNAIIRACSVHSNRQAPSRDIAWRMARANRLRHLLNGGFFRFPFPKTPSRTKTAALPHAEGKSPWLTLQLSDLESSRHRRWVCAGPGPAKVVQHSDFGTTHLGLSDTKAIPSRAGMSKKFGDWQPWTADVQIPHLPDRPQNPALFRRAESTILANGDVCRPGNFVVYDCQVAQPGSHSFETQRRIGSTVEIVQIANSPVAQPQVADFILVSRTIVGEPHRAYGMRHLEKLEELQAIPFKATHWQLVDF